MPAAGARADSDPVRAPGLRLRPTLEPFAAPDGNVYLVTGGPDAAFMVEDPSAPQRALLELLSAGVDDVPDLARRLARLGFGDDSLPVADVVDQLAALGVLEPLLTDACPDPERYARQLLYFADVAPLARPEAAQARLRDARVVVLGCGGLGSWALCGLACAGVGTLVLVDDDQVELSNLNRQLLYRAADIGRHKVEVAAEALGAFNPELDLHAVVRRVESAADIEALIDGADLLIETADWPPYDLSRWVNEACTRAGVPHISAGQAPPLLRLGPLYVPGVTACHACQEATTREAYPLFDALEAFRRSRPTPAAATLGPASGMIGSVLSMEALHHLTGLAEPATFGTSVALDLRTLEVKREPIARRPDCPVCHDVT
jgi:bacteriocin biosynthesis cyclodehydratase domain-containing protein